MLKFMVGVGGHFTLQPMARTNHKFPAWVRGTGNVKGRESYHIIMSLALRDQKNCSLVHRKLGLGSGARARARVRG